MKSFLAASSIRFLFFSIVLGLSFGIAPQKRTSVFLFNSAKSVKRKRGVIPVRLLSELPVLRAVSVTNLLKGRVRPRHTQRSSAQLEQEICHHFDPNRSQPAVHSCNAIYRELKRLPPPRQELSQRLSNLDRRFLLHRELRQ